MTNAIDDQMSIMTDASTGVHALTSSQGITTDQINARGATDADTAMRALMERQMKELMEPDANTTLGQASEKIVIGPAREIIVMPKVDLDNPRCYSDSWWIRNLAPVPKFELIHDRKPPAPPIGLSEKDIKYPPGVHNFPIYIDRMMGYKQFLS